MNSFIRYFSRYFLFFFGLIICLLLGNVVAFIATFHGKISEDFGDKAPRQLLSQTATESSTLGISDSARKRLRSAQVWAMFLNNSGKTTWTVDLPSDLPKEYTVPEVAVFSKGYLQDYPVFVQSTPKGLLVLGYPKGTYTKITANYYSTDLLKTLPIFFLVIAVLDLCLLFIAYYLSKMKVLKDIVPLISALKNLATGKATSVSVQGELSEIALEINQASQMLLKQNEARANWIAGISHDIRTPLSMIMGYSSQIVADTGQNLKINKRAQIIQRQSQKIKTLVEDLNLVSQLEYDMQPLQKKQIKLAKLIRSYLADLLNGGLSDKFSVDLTISTQAETAILLGDSTLITRAINNLMQNSVAHNPDGCDISLSLDCDQQHLVIVISDNGVGMPSEKLRDLDHKPNYLDSLDNHLSLRHGLGLLLVRMIATAHGGTVNFESEVSQGFTTSFIIPKNSL